LEGGLLVGADGVALQRHETLVAHGLQGFEGSFCMDTAFSNKAATQIIAALGGVFAGFDLTGIAGGDHVVLGVYMDDPVCEGGDKGFHLFIHKLDVAKVCHHAHVPVYILQESCEGLTAVEQEALILVNGTDAKGLGVIIDLPDGGDAPLIESLKIIRDQLRVGEVQRNGVVQIRTSQNLCNISVTLDGVALTEGVDYTYNEQTGEFATVQSRITVPAATFTTDPVTGQTVITPGTAVLRVTGTV